MELADLEPGASIWPKKRFEKNQVEIVCGDIDETRLANARELGADKTIVWKRDASVDDIVSATTESGSKKMDAAIDMVGSTATAKAGFDSLYKGSTLVLIGLAGGQL